MEFFSAILFRVFVWIVGITPFTLLYAFSDFNRFIVTRVVRYRRNVLEKNISKSFPKLSSEELNRLIQKVYKNLTDILIEGIKGLTINENTLLKRHRIINPEILTPYFEQGQSVMGVLGHFNNWEWGSLSAGMQLKHKIVALYKPLLNKQIDSFVKRIRAKHGTTLVSIAETSKAFIRFKNNPSLFLLVADQSPGNLERAIWVNFLGRETPFLHGPEIYAKMHKFPVFFIDIQRIKRGYYEIEFVPISNDPSKLDKDQLTKQYASKLESQIIQNPASWMWTHRRWKHVKV